MNETNSTKQHITKRQIAVVVGVYGLLGLAQILDLHSTALGLASGRIELNPIASASSAWLSPLASVIAIKLAAASLMAMLFRVWVKRSDARDFFPHVVMAGALPLVATSLAVWRNYQ
jgi:hypothetical protein